MFNINKKICFKIISVLILFVLSFEVLKYNCEKLDFAIDSYGEATFVLKSKIHKNMLYVDVLGPLVKHPIKQNFNDSDIEVIVQDKDGVTIASTIVPHNQIYYQPNENISFHASVNNINWYDKFKGLSISLVVPAKYALEPYISNNLSNLCGYKSRNLEYSLDEFTNIMELIAKKQPKTKEEFYKIIEQQPNSDLYKKYISFEGSNPWKAILEYDDLNVSYNEIQHIQSMGGYCLINNIRRDTLVTSLKILNDLGIKSQSDLNEVEKVLHDSRYYNGRNMQSKSKWLDKMNEVAPKYYSYQNSYLYIEPAPLAYKHSYILLEYSDKLKKVMPVFVYNKHERQKLYQICKKDQKEDSLYICDRP